MAINDNDLALQQQNAVGAQADVDDGKRQIYHVGERIRDVRLQELDHNLVAVLRASDTGSYGPGSEEWQKAQRIGVIKNATSLTSGLFRDHNNGAIQAHLMQVAYSMWSHHRDNTAIPQDVGIAYTSLTDREQAAVKRTITTFYDMPPKNVDTIVRDVVHQAGSDSAQIAQTTARSYSLIPFMNYQLGPDVPVNNLIAGWIRRSGPIPGVTDFGNEQPNNNNNAAAVAAAAAANNGAHPTDQPAAAAGPKSKKAPPANSAAARTALKTTHSRAVTSQPAAAEYNADKGVVTGHYAAGQTSFADGTDIDAKITKLVADIQAKAKTGPVSVTVAGFASHDGDPDKNKDLATKRAADFQARLKAKLDAAGVTGVTIHTADPTVTNRDGPADRYATASIDQAAAPQVQANAAVQVSAAQAQAAAAASAQAGQGNQGNNGAVAKAAPLAEQVTNGPQTASINPRFNTALLQDLRKRGVTAIDVRFPPLTGPMSAAEEAARNAPYIQAAVGQGFSKDKISFNEDRPTAGTAVFNVQNGITATVGPDGKVVKTFVALRAGPQAVANQ